MKSIWIALSVIGTVVPFIFVIPFFQEHGLNIPLFLDFLFINSVSQFFAVDLVISSVCFLLWSYLDSRKINLSGWWMVLIANCCVGLSLAIPLYFYKREKIR